MNLSIWIKNDFIEKYYKNDILNFINNYNLLYDIYNQSKINFLLTNILNDSIYIDIKPIFFKKTSNLIIEIFNYNKLKNNVNNYLKDILFGKYKLNINKNKNKNKNVLQYLFNIIKNFNKYLYDLYIKNYKKIVNKKAQSIRSNKINNDWYKKLNISNFIKVFKSNQQIKLQKVSKINLMKWKWKYRLYN